MLDITIPSQEYFNEKTQEFVTTKPCTIQLEHSLVSLSRWESKWGKPFLKKNEKKTAEETIDYIRCMTVTQNVKPEVYNMLPAETIERIKTYIEAPMTATWFKEDNKRPSSREIVTAELIYYWMIAQNIPMECQKWHLNRLLTLIRVCGIKNNPKKGKQSKADMLANRRALNELRKSQLDTKG